MVVSLQAMHLEVAGTVGHVAVSLLGERTALEAYWSSLMVTEPSGSTVNVLTVGY